MSRLLLIDNAKDAIYCLSTMFCCLLRNALSLLSMKRIHITIIITSEIALLCSNLCLRPTVAVTCKRPGHYKYYLTDCSRPKLIRIDDLLKSDDPTLMCPCLSVFNFTH